MTSARRTDPRRRAKGRRRRPADAARIRSFPPIAGPGVHTLILGSMPGAASLAAARYYAHPRNAFWRIAGALLGFDAGAPYPARTRALAGAGFALWDVLQSCERSGSLDAAIPEHSEVANDFAAFLRDHPGVHRIFFNGAKAEASFRRRVLPQLEAAGAARRLSLTRLPSTSPAHAGLPFERKLEAWRAILRRASKGGT